MFKRAKGIVLLGKASLGTSPNAQHNLGWYATPEALQTAHPTANDGDFAIVGSTDTVWVWDGDTSAWVDTNTIDFANKNLSNLTDTGANIANWSSNVSNCITNIPQDINISLVNGVLTIKAGTKAYKPDGSSFTLTSDIVVPIGSGTNTPYFIFADPNNTATRVQISTCYSGSTAPTFSGTALWLDTENKIIKYSADSGATWSNTANSLPIAIATPGATEWTSLDQVFNGFGYMGSTVFVLPGVKYLAPNGRNTDGTLKTYVNTYNTVHKWTAGNITDTRHIVGYNNQITGAGILYQQTPVNGKITFDMENNISYSSLSVSILVDFGVVTVSSGKVTSLNIKTPFHAVDYSDTEFIGHQAMPSDKYVNLTLGANGSTYTAPADGYLTLVKGATASGQYMIFINNRNSASVSSIATGALNCRLLMPVSKGDVITINYTVDGTTGLFKFIYANSLK